MTNTRILSLNPCNPNEDCPDFCTALEGNDKRYCLMEDGFKQGYAMITQEGTSKRRLRKERNEAWHEIARLKALCAAYERAMPHNCDTCINAELNEDEYPCRKSIVKIDCWQFDAARFGGEEENHA